MVQSYLALSKTKEALYAAREAMKAMPQSAKALTLVGDVHASHSGGREKVKLYDTLYMCACMYVCMCVHFHVPICESLKHKSVMRSFYHLKEP